MNDRICSIDGCGGTGRLIRGWCVKHYSRWSRSGDPLLKKRADHGEGCSVDGCDNPHRSLGYCEAHYLRNLRYGDPLGGAARNFDSPEQAFAARTEWRGDCLIWTGGRTSHGYGQIRVGGRQEHAHRYAYRRTHGDIPEGLVVRHKCDTPLCVNADHLEVGTQRENMGDMIARGRASWQKVRTA